MTICAHVKSWLPLLVGRNNLKQTLEENEHKGATG